MARLAFDAAIVGVTVELLRNWSNRSLEGKLSRGGLAPKTLNIVTACIRDRLSEDIPLGELAALARLSSYHFCRAFKQSTGFPPHRYQITMRIERAKELLADGAMSICDVAACVGYQDQGVLARLFRKEVGMTPSNYRRDRQS